MNTSLIGTAFSFSPLRPKQVDLFLSMMRDFYALERIDFRKSIAARSIVYFLKHRDLGRAWLIRVGPNVAGYLVTSFSYSLEHHGLNALIDEIFILPPFRGNGLGTAALRFLAEFCRRKKISSIFLTVAYRNSRARKFYAREGYETHERAIMGKSIEKW